MVSGSCLLLSSFMLLLFYLVLFFIAAAMHASPAKNTIRIGRETTRDAAENTGQLPLIYVACREYNPAASV